MMDIAKAGLLFLDRFGNANIILEPMPSGNRFLEPILDAMEGERYISIQYRKYSAADISQYVGIPICLKQYNRRWYLLLQVKDHYITFCLDRIVDFEIIPYLKVTSNQDTSCFFDDCFGVYSGRDLPQAEDIIVRAHGERQYYLDDLQLHDSQRLIYRSSSYADYRLHLRAGREFVSEVLRLGGQLEVLSPSWLRGQVYDTACKIMALHKS